MNEPRSTIRGRRILLVEDVLPVGLMLEAMVHAFDGDVAARPETFAETRRLACTLDFDAGLMATEAWGEPIFPVAMLLRERQIPFVLAVAQRAYEVPREWRFYPLIAKPYRMSNIGHALSAALRNRHAAPQLSCA